MPNFTDDDRQLRKDLDLRMRGMRASRSGYDYICAEVARYCQPKLGRMLMGYAAVANGANPGHAAVRISNNDKLNEKLLNSSALKASNTLANGMYSGLTSPARPWFKLTVADPELREYQAVKEWLDLVERRIYDFFNSTNFYNALKTGYLELGVFGTSAAFMTQHWRHGGVTHPLTFGEYWISLDDGLVADSLSRRCDMTVKQMVERFGLANIPAKVRERYDKGEYETTYEVFHIVEPNTLRQGGRYDAKNKAFRSVYWTPVAELLDPPLLSVSGFDQKPFWAPRWDVQGSETYGTSPGMEAMATSRGLQLKELRKQQGIDYVLKPALTGPATLNNVNVSLQPGRVTAMANVDRSTFGPIWEVDPSAIGQIREDILDSKQQIDEHFFADLFNAITNMRGIQPRNIEEIAARNEEKLTQLGPVVERVHNEQLNVSIDRAFEILNSIGLIPPPPEEMQGMPIGVEFISVLAQAQRMIGLGSIERYAGFLGTLSATHPSVLDKFDADQAADEYADIVGVPARIVRSDDQVEEIRGQRAQAEQQAAAAEQAAALAPAAKQGVEAASLLFDSPGVGSGPSLADRLLGTG